MSSHCLFSRTAQEHLIKGESNLSSRSGEEHSGAPSTRSPVRAVILTGDARVGLVSNVNRQGNILPNEMPPPWMSPVGRVITAVKPWKVFFFFSYSTVLQNFSRKSRNTVSVREGQAVVLLCGPPPHYGGTALCLNSSAMSAVVSHSCLPQQSLLFLTPLLIISL